MQLDARGFSMRICLKDIIGTDNEKVFMQYLEDNRKKFSVPVLLKFWYNDGTISEKKLSNFVTKYKHILAYYGTKIYTLESLKNNLGDEAWFNVTDKAGWRDKGRTFRVISNMDEGSFVGAEAQGQSIDNSCSWIIYGDLNQDLYLNILDVILMLSCINNETCTDCSDINSDGDADILDIVTLVNIVLNR